MKLSRFKAIYNGMNGTAKKVYEAVPINSHWSQHKIMKELERLGKHMEPQAVQGCLGYMVSVGIVEQNKERDFKRTPIKMASPEPDDTPYIEPSKEDTQMATNPPSPLIPAPPSSNPTFDLLLSLASRAQSIADMADDLKEDIEKAALQVQMSHENTSKELEKLKKFKELMALMKE